MKFVSWNVNGLRAILKKGFENIFDDFNADIFAIQEIKCQDGQVVFNVDNYTHFYSFAQRKGYSGTAVFCKSEPEQVIYKMWDEQQALNDSDISVLDNEGRLIALEFKKFWFVCVYTPNAQNELARIEPRLKWGERFRDFCKELEHGSHNLHSASVKPVIMCGDFNVAHKEIDLKNPKRNEGHAGFSIEERNDFTELLNSGFTDSFRKLYPDKTDAYSWWSYRAQSRKRNVGWRLDYFLVSQSLNSKIIDSIIYSDVLGSDHCPIGLHLDI